VASPTLAYAVAHIALSGRSKGADFSRVYS